MGFFLFGSGCCPFFFLTEKLYDDDDATLLQLTSFCHLFFFVFFCFAFLLTSGEITAGIIPHLLLFHCFSFDSAESFLTGFSNPI
jgi:hypothetical protein